MNSSKTLVWIDRIAALSGKNDKLKLLDSAIGHEFFARVCEYAYDPFKTYGLRQIPERSASQFGGSDCDNDFDEEVFAMLDNMAARRLTGNAAKQAVQETLNMLNEQSADLLTRILRKDLRAGFSESSINKVCAGLISEFPYQRCSLPKDAKFQTWQWESGAISQEKADGMFANGDHELSGNVSLRSRQGTEFPMEKFPEIEREIRERLTPGYQQHGEIVVFRDGVLCARQDGNGVMNHVLSGGDFAPNERPVYMVWDQIPLSSVMKKGKCDTPYKVRFGSLLQQLKRVGGSSVMVIPTRIVKSLGEAYKHAGELMKAGKEGSVVKNPLGIWKDGTSKDQIKLKLEFEVDLIITGIVPGRAGTKNAGRAGSLSCKTSDGKLLTDVTVKNEAMRLKVDENPDDWIGRVIAVTANDITEPSDSNPLHSLFLPRMSEANYRTDKTTADCLARVIAQKHAAIFGQELKEAA